MEGRRRCQCLPLHPLPELGLHGNGLRHSKLAEGKPLRKVLAWVWAALICASTVFTKQHSVIDVVCGGLGGFFVWVPVVYGPWRGRIEQNKKLPGLDFRLLLLLTVARQLGNMVIY